MFLLIRFIRLNACGGGFLIRHSFLATTPFFDTTKEQHIFVTIDEIEIGAFGGLGLGKKTFDDPLREKWGAVVNLNLGIRANIATHHGVELFYTHDFAAASIGDSVFIGSYRSIAIEYSKPSVFGVRYTFSF